MNIFWFRNDLRTHDLPGLNSLDGPVTAVYIFHRHQTWAWGSASRVWLHHSLVSLAGQLAELGIPFLIEAGDPLEVLPRITERLAAKRVHFGKSFLIADRDERIAEKLKGAVVERFNHSLLLEPGSIQTKDKKHYTVYTPFSKACFERLRNITYDKFLMRPMRRGSAISCEKSLQQIHSLNLLPQLPWGTSVAETWKIGEQAAIAEIKKFCMGPLLHYKSKRDFPSLPYCSKMSPRVHFGEISPYRLWYFVESALKDNTKHQEEIFHYLKELLWREFAYHLFFHEPHTDKKPLRAAFEKFPWDENPEALDLWKKGMTGYPIVDAAMRQLWQTGWMHNRLRMVVASFLVKDLLIPWQKGAEWFWDTLFDADLPNNSLGWQWTAGCGADAAPYFRVFHPILQGEKFDPDGDFVRQFVPELQKLPNAWLHRPFEAPAEELKKAGVILGKTYPQPCVDHGVARILALKAYDKIKG